MHVRRVLVPSEPDYGRLWYRIGGTLLTASDRQGAALEHFNECLEWFPDDAWLLLGRGSNSETLARLLERPPPDSRLVGWQERPRDAPRRLDHAAALLAPLRAARLSRVLEYWASLVAGAVEEERGDPEAAADHYRNAMRVYPDAQSAAIALSRVLIERLDSRETGHGGVASAAAAVGVA